MRRRIRLTGRRQLSRSCVAVKATSVPSKRLLTFSIVDSAPFRPSPKDSLISVRLYEIKLVEVVNFGTVGSPAAVADLKNQTFVAPSCQLRVATAMQDSHLLLGSSDTWTL